MLTKHQSLAIWELSVYKQSPTKAPKKMTQDLQALKNSKTESRPAKKVESFEIRKEDRRKEKRQSQKQSQDPQEDLRKNRLQMH